jgi:hypothetical protein
MSTTTIQERNRDEPRTDASNTESRASTGSTESTPPEVKTESRRDDPPEDRSDLPRDLLFGLLSTERRRRLLQYLDENGGETTVDTSFYIVVEWRGTTRRVPIQGLGGQSTIETGFIGG